MNYLNCILFFLLLATSAFGQLQDPPPAYVVRYMESYNQCDAYAKWIIDNYVYDRCIANINKETRGVKWRFFNKYTPNSCYERLSYLSTYLYKRKIGKARVCLSSDSVFGIKLWMDLDKRKVRSIRDFVKMPNLFNDTLDRKNILKYEKIAGKIGEQVYRDVISGESVEYNKFIIIYFRAKKCESSLCCIVVKKGGLCSVKASYFLPTPLY